MPNLFDPSSWVAGVTIPQLSDYLAIKTDLATRGQHIDGGGYGRANTGFLVLNPGAFPGASFGVISASWSGGVATLNIGTHNIQVNQLVSVSSILPAGYNKAAAITAVTSTTISYALGTNPGAYASGGIIIVAGTSPAPGMMVCGPDGQPYLYKSGAFQAFAVGSVASSNWTAAALEHGWTNLGGGYNAAQYMLDSLGFVHIRAVITNGTTTDGIVLFTLPPGFRPPATVGFNISNGFAQHAQMRIDSSGLATLNGASGYVILFIMASFSVSTSTNPTFVLGTSLGTTTQQLVGGSPYTYTAGAGLEFVYISGGAVSSVKRNGVDITASLPLSVWLPPGNSVTIVFSETPLVVVDK